LIIGNEVAVVENDRHRPCRARAGGGRAGGSRENSSRPEVFDDPHVIKAIIKKSGLEAFVADEERKGEEDVFSTKSAVHSGDGRALSAQGSGVLTASPRASEGVPASRNHFPLRTPSGQFAQKG